MNRRDAENAEKNILHPKPLAKVFRSWFDKLTTNVISESYQSMSVRPDPVEGQNSDFCRRLSIHP
jgi:hypothetical protein